MGWQIIPFSISQNNVLWFIRINIKVNVFITNVYVTKDKENEIRYRIISVSIYIPVVLQFIDIKLYALTVCMVLYENSNFS